jgi:hypothetical protein
MSFAVPIQMYPHRFAIYQYVDLLRTGVFLICLRATPRHANPLLLFRRSASGYEVPSLRDMVVMSTSRRKVSLTIVSGYRTWSYFAGEKLAERKVAHGCLFVINV